jgi:hypothetical protein
MIDLTLIIMAGGSCKSASLEIRRGLKKFLNYLHVKLVNILFDGDIITLRQGIFTFLRLKIYVIVVLLRKYSHFAGEKSMCCVV